LSYYSGWFLENGWAEISFNVLWINNLLDGGMNWKQ